MAYYAARRKKPCVNRRVALQFISTMASVEGGSKSIREEEEDASSTASDDSFIVGDDILTNLLLLFYFLKYINFLYKLYGPGTYISSSFTLPSLHFSV